MKDRKSIFRVLLSRNMKHGRKLLKITQSMLAEKCAISTSFVAEIELCRKFPSPEILERIARSLHVRPYQLFFDQDHVKIDERNDLVKELYSHIKDRLHSDIDNIIDSYG